MRELFIYYQLQFNDAVDAGALQTEVLAMQRGLQFKHRGLQARLLKRPATTDEWQQTWMETYAWPQHAGGITPALQHEIEQRAAAVLLGYQAGVQRHMEVFTSCA
jgi:hypothetical protein